MHYDQSWMGYGFVGGLQAGLITAFAALLLFGVFHWLGRRNDFGYGAQISWAYLLALLITASGDGWDLFYFNFGRLQSLQLLKAKLALVHDPDGIGIRVLCEFIGAAAGVYLGWVICHSPWGRHVLKPGRKQTD